MNPATARLTVWTVQPTDFDLPQVSRLDCQRGTYWQTGDGNLQVRDRYRELLPMVHQHVGTDQILWCMSSTFGPVEYEGRAYELPWEERDGTVLWELELPTVGVLAHFDTMKWGRAFHEPPGTPCNLSRIALLQEYPIKARCEVLVRWPLGPNSRLTNLGPLSTGYWTTQTRLGELQAQARRR
jgi:hypothetical protein